MDSAPLIPFVVTSFAARVAEATGIEPTITRQPRRRWLVELRTDRAHATHWFRDDWRTGTTVSASGHTLEIDGVVRDPVQLELLAHLIRYPDGKPGTLPPLTEEIDPEHAPRRVRQTYQDLQQQLAKHPQIRVCIGRTPANGIDLAIDLDERSGLHIPFRETDRGWAPCSDSLVLIVEGMDRSHEVAAGGLAMAMKILMTTKGHPAAPETTSTTPAATGTTSAAKVTATSVRVRNDTVVRT